MALPFASDAAPAPVPRVPGWEHTAALLADPYRFIGRACRTAGSDVVQVRLLLRRTLCLTGPHAAELFYDQERFRRGGAAPEPVRATLFGKAGVQGLDGLAHRDRKRFFLQACGPPEAARLVAIAALLWEQLAPRWRQNRRFALYAAVQDWLARTACRWAGVPLHGDEVGLRTQQLVALFDAAAGGLRPHLHARRARHAAEGWLSELARAWVEPDAFRPERFLGIVPGPFELVPQGGGRAEVHHRCPGEGFTLALMKLAVRRFAVHSRYDVPSQDLRIRMDRLPALPADLFVVSDFRSA